MSWLPEELGLSTVELRRLLKENFNDACPVSQDSEHYRKYLQSARDFYKSQKWLQDEVAEIKKWPRMYEQPIRIRMPWGRFLLSDLEADSQ